MKNNILMNFEEPSDIQLIELMNEVATKAKSKALIERKHLSEKVTNEIMAVQSRINANKK